MKWEKWENGAPLWGFGTMEEIGVKDRGLYLGHSQYVVAKVPLPNFRFRYPDKLAHLLAWCGMTVLLSQYVDLYYAIAIPAVIGLVWEFTVDAAPSWRDLIADAVGIALGVWLC